MRIIMTTLAIVGGLALLLIVAAVGFGVVGAAKGYQFAKGAAAYADETIAAYGKSWDSAALIDRASPEFLAAIAQSPNSLAQLSNLLVSQAGPLESAAPASCSNFNYTVTTEGGDVFTAQCFAQGVVRKGTAQFTVTVVNREKNWRLMGLFVYVTPRPGDQPTASKLVNFSEKRKAPRATVQAGFRGKAVGVSLGSRALTYAANSEATPLIGVRAEISFAGGAEQPTLQP